MNKYAKFWDRMADGYSKKPLADEAAYKKKVQVTQEYFRSDMEVFEFGCGTGSTAIIHAPYVKHILATDISSRMIEIAQGKARAKDIQNITFRQAMLDDFDNEQDRFDVVLGMSILHLLPNKEEAIAKAYRLLKPGGVFVSNTACIQGPMSLLKYVIPVASFFGLLPQVQFFSAEELKRNIISAGFEIDYLWQKDKSLAVFIVARKKG